MTSHLDDGTIQELIDGEIPSSALDHIRDHLAECAECRARLGTAQAQADEADVLLEALDDPVAPAHPVAVVPLTAARSHAWVRRAAWAASLVIAVGAGYYARGNPVGTVVEMPARQEVREGPAAAQPLPSPHEASPRPGAATSPVTEPTISRPPGALAGAATSTTTNPAARREVSTDAADASTGRLTPPAAAAPALSANAAEAPAERARVGEGVSAQSRGMLGRTANQFAARDQLSMKQGVATAPDTIDFTRAVSVMGGRLLLIVGMVPVRLELAGREVRVVYRVNEGELVLAQSVQAGVVSHWLLAPPGFHADSLAALRSRVRE